MPKTGCQIKTARSVIRENTPDQNPSHVPTAQVLFYFFTIRKSFADLLAEIPICVGHAVVHYRVKSLASILPFSSMMLSSAEIFTISPTQMPSSLNLISLHSNVIGNSSITGALTNSLLVA